MRCCTSGPTSSAAGSSTPRGLTCEICGSQMLERHCKIQCPNCGYTRDCSDP